MGIEQFMHGLVRRNPGEFEFHQAVMEVAESLIPFIDAHPEYQDNQLLERLAEPDRIVIFRVCWEDDSGCIRTNRGYRVQHSNAIGPYKGGLRFDPNVTLSVLKFLAFEQTFKNSLTGLPMGAGKGGADFNPKGKSSREVMRFCQSYMTELQRHIGPDTDVPAGDIGVGAREIGFMYGQYKRVANCFSGVLTGKGLEYGGSLIRAEATGYGAVYMMDYMLERQNDQVDGKTVVISGSGNVAIFAAEKVLQLGGKVVTLSDSSGYIYDADGFNEEKLEFLKDLKFIRRGRVKEYADHFGATFVENQRPWAVPCDLALPCATQNELDEADAQMLVKNGCIGVSEGANMPTVPEAITVFQNAKILYGPSKAANAGGVAVSGLEMSQNSARISWEREDLDLQLQRTMHKIHQKCVRYGSEGDYVNYLKGANIAGFVKVADAMLAYGIV